MNFTLKNGKPIGAIHGADGPRILATIREKLKDEVPDQEKIDRCNEVVILLFIIVFQKHTMQTTKVQFAQIYDICFCSTVLSLCNA